MKSSVQISRGIESLFGTRDENIRLIESGLNVRTRLLNDSLEIEGDDANVARAAGILDDYVALTRDGHVFNNGDLNSFLRVIPPTLTLAFDVGEKRKAAQLRQENHYAKNHEPAPLLRCHRASRPGFRDRPARTGKTYLAVAMAVAALYRKRVSRIVLTRPAVEAGERLGFLPGTCRKKWTPICARSTTRCMT